MCMTSFVEPNVHFTSCLKEWSPESPYLRTQCTVQQLNGLEVIKQTFESGNTPSIRYWLIRPVLYVHG
jgi:hypothetical protein